MTWTIIILLAVGVASLRLLGMYGGTALVRRVPMFERLGSLIPAAVVSAVIAQLTFASGKSLTIDARSAGVAVAAVLIWRREIGRAPVREGVRRGLFGLRVAR